MALIIYVAYLVLFAAEDAGFYIVGAFPGAHRRIDAYTLKTSDAPAQALAERLLGLGVDQITTDDPEGLAALLGATNG
jgi:glycerophosphoryl diester phosphodiesterase